MIYLKRDKEPTLYPASLCKGCFFYNNSDKFDCSEIDKVICEIKKTYKWRVISENEYKRLKQKAKTWNYSSLASAMAAEQGNGQGNKMFLLKAKK